MYGMNNHRCDSSSKSFNG